MPEGRPRHRRMWLPVSPKSKRARNLRVMNPNVTDFGSFANGGKRSQIGAFGGVVTHSAGLHRSQAAYCVDVSEQMRRYLKQLGIWTRGSRAIAGRPQ